MIKITRTIIYRGKKYLIKKSPRRNKQLLAITPSGKKIHFGDPKMPEFPGTKRGGSYCARSFGIKGKNNPLSANFWSRKYLWHCVGKKSMKTKKAAGLK